MPNRSRLLAFGIVLAIANAALADPIFLLTERNASTVRQWDAMSGTSSVYQSVRANDVDLNTAQGSSHAWIAEHFTDHIGRFVPGSGSGLDQQYDLGTGGRTHYAYPKHVTVFDGNVIVMSRNDARLFQYDTDGNQLSSVATGNGTGQGMATDGTNLYVSFWDGANSYFEVYDSSLMLQGTFANPSGLGFSNIFDFAYDPTSGHFFGLATDGEGGTGTNSSTVVEFDLGGSVVQNHSLGFSADGIGQFNNSAAQTVPEPAGIAVWTILLLTVVAAGFYRRYRGLSVVG